MVWTVTRLTGGDISGYDVVVGRTDTPTHVRVVAHMQTDDLGGPAPAWSPDGSTIAYAFVHGKTPLITLVSPAGTRRRKPAEGGRRLVADRNPAARAAGR